MELYAALRTDCPNAEETAGLARSVACQTSVSHGKMRSRAVRYSGAEVCRKADIRTVSSSQGSAVKLYEIFRMCWRLMHDSLTKIGAGVEQWKLSA